MREGCWGGGKCRAVGINAAPWQNGAAASRAATIATPKPHRCSLRSPGAQPPGCWHCNPTVLLLHLQIVTAAPPDPHHHISTQHHLILKSSQLHQGAPTYMPQSLPMQLQIPIVAPHNTTPSRRRFTPKSPLLHLQTSTTAPHCTPKLPFPPHSLPPSPPLPVAHPTLATPNPQHHYAPFHTQIPTTAPSNLHYCNHAAPPGPLTVHLHLQKHTLKSSSSYPQVSNTAPKSTTALL